MSGTPPIHIVCATRQPAQALSLTDLRVWCWADALVRLYAWSGREAVVEWYLQNQGEEADQLAEAVVRTWLQQQGLKVTVPEHLSRGPFIEKLVQQLNLNTYARLSAAEMPRLKKEIATRACDLLATQAVELLAGVGVHVARVTEVPVRVKHVLVAQTVRVLGYDEQELSQTIQHLGATALRFWLLTEPLDRALTIDVSLIHTRSSANPLFDFETAQQQFAALCGADGHSVPSTLATPDAIEVGQLSFETTTEHTLAQLILELDSVLNQALQERNPSILPPFAATLARAAHIFYTDAHLGSGVTPRPERRVLARAAHHALQSVGNILGICA